ncbi:hypothetical protein KR009_010378, partial [Drosophila setifemur]
MFASKRKLQTAYLSLWLSAVLAQNASDERVTGRAGNQIDLASSATGKGYQPELEFYRGPGSGSGLGSGPLSGTNSHPSLGSVGESLSETYNKWRGGAGGGLQQRISVGHYGGSGEVAAHPLPVGSFESHSHPYPYEYTHSNGGGIGAGAGAAVGAGLGAGIGQGIGAGIGAGAGHGPVSGAYFGSSSVEAAIPFDVYGTRLGHGLAHGHYAPSEYAHPYPLEHYEFATHKGPGHGEVSPKALLAKSFLIPLASAAVLGIAAALVSNPLLLQLGTVSGLGTAIVGKRKRRS